MWRLCPRECLQRHTASEFDLELSNACPCWSKCEKPIVLEPSCIDKVCFIYMHPLDEFNEATSIFCNETCKSREMAIHHT